MVGHPEVIVCNIFTQLTTQVLMVNCVNMNMSNYGLY